jgi:dTDP-4-dehydrorhamnose reductase
MASVKMKILIIGKGWLGSRCAEEWPDAVISGKWIKSVDDALSLLDKYRPDAVLNAAGIVGQPNVDWCETHQLETISGNTILPLLIAEACQKRHIYLLHMGTGCIYYGYSKNEKGWSEEDFANPTAVYTKCKYAADLALSTLPNVGVARIRMPIDYRPSPRSYIDKIVSFPKLINMQNSATIVEDMIQVFRQLLVKKAEGIFHVTNPGFTSQREIIHLHKKYVDPQHQNKWIKEKDLVGLGLTKKKRSNNILQSTRLKSYGIKMRPIKSALLDTIKKYARCKKEVSKV